MNDEMIDFMAKTIREAKIVEGLSNSARGVKGPNCEMGAWFSVYHCPLAFACVCSPASDCVRCIRTSALKMWTIDKLKTPPFPSSTNKHE